MATREGRYDAGTARGERAVADIGGELRAARLDRGLSQEVVAAAAHICRSKLSRIERGRYRMVSIVDLSRLASIVGLELSIRAYPGGQPIRDAAQRALLDRLRKHTAASGRWRYEVPLAERGNQRGWDAWLILHGVVGVEAETRPRDIQAVQRRVNLKLRDDPRVEMVILLLADTRRNRHLMREHGEALRAEYPCAGTELLADLAAGRRPRGSGVILI